ncbi:MAG: glucose-6-phosphate isomerase [Betaproteobacteria bacterium]|nr:glucose-6-phosphate isomerase [Betaproteobacteria bacterium]
MSRTTLPAWRALAALAPQHAAHRAPHGFLVSGAGLTLDLSRQYLGAGVLRPLEQLAVECAVAQRRDALLRGEPINVTENRAVLHALLRSGAAAPLAGVEGSAEVAAELDALRDLTDRIRGGRLRGLAGRPFTDVVAIGIGGSSLGPQLAVQALPKTGPRLHFVSNIDGAALEDTLAPLDAATTLFLVISKTFTTEETLTNARSAQAWLHARLGPDPVDAHFVAITARPAAVAASPVKAGQVLRFWDWVGGRYSLWSTVGLPIALSAGMAAFEDMLAGARAMDMHFRDAPFAGNLPMLLAAAGVWNRTFLGMPGLAVLPYAHRLARLPAYLQQLEMESNGKRVDLEGRALDYETCPLLFGEPGTDGQHSFHQWLHQGTSRAAHELIVVARPMSALGEHHDKLLANALAQADAFWLGRDNPDGHRHYPGGRPVSLITLPALDAFHFGALIALYEHKVFTQGVLWNINSFDQMGVELGKQLATSLAAAVRGEAAPPDHLAAYLSALRAMHVR